MKTEYCIVHGHTFIDVANKVRDLIGENWVPQGGVSVTVSRAIEGKAIGGYDPSALITIIAQAMVRTKLSAE